MPKVGIMADVSAEVFENVVSPAKAEKRFNKLVSNLLETYYTNDKVRAFVDGKEEESHIEGLSSLQEQLAQATNSLNTMGLYGDSLQMSLDSAKDEFSDVASTERLGPGVSSEASASDLEEFKKEILDSQRSFMEEMKSMLSSVLSGSVSISSSETVSKPKEEAVEVSEPSSERSFAPLVSLPTVAEEDPTALFEVVEEESKPADVSGEDILKNLVGMNNSISFGG